MSRGLAAPGNAVLVASIASAATSQPTPLFANARLVGIPIRLRGFS